MALTRSFKETVQTRVERDPEFRQALLEEAIELLLEGDANTCKIILRDYINATVGFETLSQATGKPTKSLMRMFSPSGNPNMQSLCTVLAQLQERTGTHLEVHAVSC